MSKCSRAYVCLLCVFVFLSTIAFAVTPDRINGNLATGRVVTLRGNVHHKALPQFDRGLADPSLRFGSMTLLTTPTPSQVRDMQTLSKQQQDPKSPQYHKWLTPEQFADRFGLSHNDLAKITKWLQSQGFTVGTVARGRNWISFSGTVAQVQATFGTEIHRFNVDGQIHVANATEPHIPSSIAGLVTGIRGLDDFHVRPRGVHHNFAARPMYSSSNFGQVIAPGDIATIYDINALYNASPAIDGTGQKLAIIGQTDVFLSDLNDFRSGFGLPSIACTTTTTGTVGVISACNDPHFKYIFVNNETTTDPLVPLSGDLAEADLDLEWSGATARNAQIVYVNAPAVFSGNKLVSGGVWDAWYYAVDQQLAPVISMSYGLCEFFDNNVLDVNTGASAADELQLIQANLEGITFVNSSGDFGAAECDSNTTLTPSAALATQGIGVGYPASSPEVTGVGGTAIPLTNFGSNYWSNSNGTDGGSALSYVPEQAWNDDDEIGQFCAQNPTSSFCQSNAVSDALSAQAAIGVSSTGGGASNCALQTTDFSSCAAGFAQPDWQSVSISGQTGVRFSPDVSLLATANFPGYIFCTQLSELNVSGSGSSCASGIEGALNLTDKNGNPTGSVIGGTSASAPIFAGIVTLMNQYLGASAPLGNINPALYNLAHTAPNAFHPTTTSNNQVYCQQGTPSGMPWNIVCPASGVLGFLGSSSDATTAYNLVTGLGSVDVANLAPAWKSFATQPSFTLTRSTGFVSAAAGSDTTATTITIVPQNGFTGTVDFSCSGLPTGATCSFSPTSSTTTTSLTIQTTAGMASVQNVSVVVTGTSGALSSSTDVGLSVTGGTSSFTLQSSVNGGTLAVNRGSTALVDLGVYSTDGFVVNSSGVAQTGLPVTYACTGLPAETTCSFSPSSTTSSVAVTLSIRTTAPSSAMRRDDRHSGIFYAVLLPGLLGIVFTLGSRKRLARGVQMFSLVLVLGMSTMWMASCGGSSSSGGGGNSGTPPGSYPITINATTSGGPSSSAHFTLQVN